MASGNADSAKNQQLSNNRIPVGINISEIYPYSCPRCKEPFSYRVHNRAEKTVPLILHCNHNMCLGCVEQSILDAMNPSTTEGDDLNNGGPAGPSASRFRFHCAVCRHPQTTRVMGEAYNVARAFEETEIIGVYPLDVNLIGVLVVKDQVARNKVSGFSADQALHAVHFDEENLFQRNQRTGSAQVAPLCMSCHRPRSRAQCAICQKAYCPDCQHNHEQVCRSGTLQAGWEYYGHNGRLLTGHRSCPQHRQPVTYLCKGTGELRCIECADSNTGAEIVDLTTWNTQALLGVQVATRFWRETLQRTESCLAAVNAAASKLEESHQAERRVLGQFFRKIKASLVSLTRVSLHNLASCAGKRVGFLHGLEDVLALQLARLECLLDKVAFIARQSVEETLKVELENIGREIMEFGLWNPTVMEMGRLPVTALDQTHLTDDMTGHLRSCLDLIEDSVNPTDAAIKARLDLQSVTTLGARDAKT